MDLSVLGGIGRGITQGLGEIRAQDAELRAKNAELRAQENQDYQNWQRDQVKQQQARDENINSIRADVLKEMGPDADAYDVNYETYRRAGQNGLITQEQMNKGAEYGNAVKGRNLTRAMLLGDINQINKQLGGDFVVGARDGKDEYGIKTRIFDVKQADGTISQITSGDLGSMTYYGDAAAAKSKASAEQAVNASKAAYIRAQTEGEGTKQRLNEARINTEGAHADYYDNMGLASLKRADLQRDINEYKKMAKENGTDYTRLIANLQREYQISNPDATEDEAFSYAMQMSRTRKESSNKEDRAKLYKQSMADKEAVSDVRRVITQQVKEQLKKEFPNASEKEINSMVNSRSDEIENKVSDFYINNAGHTQRGLSAIPDKPPAPPPKPAQTGWTGLSLLQPHKVTPGMDKKEFDAIPIGATLQFPDGSTRIKVSPNGMTK